MFVLSRNDFSVRATGFRQVLDLGRARNLEQAVAEALGADGSPGCPLVVGALPFDAAAAPFLFQPQEVEWGDGTGRAPLLRSPRETPWTITAVRPRPDSRDYARLVAKALARMDDPALPALKKVVLARALEIETAEAIDPLVLAARLAADRSVTTFMLDLSPLSGTAGHGFVGATPELLVSRRGLNVTSRPLAGSAARSADDAADRAAGEALLASAKDRREHALVVEAILDLLAPLCSRLDKPEGPALYSTRTMWHLGTHIEGELKNGEMPSAVGLAALLHPTPAVGGYPREAALECIRATEPYSRGFYAGAVGWSGASGDGDWYVALRCAEVRPRNVVLHAGAGIVAGSDPDAEARETSAKFRAMLEALGASELEDLKEPAN